MPRSKRRKPVSRSVPVDNQRRRPLPRRRSDLPQVTFDEPRRNLYFHIFVIVLLLVFGTYVSVLYFGHQVVPNSDFPAFFETGRAILSFELPSSFKRVPLLGILQVTLSHIVGGQHPDLTAGWLVNALLYPLMGVFLYLLGKQLIGKHAVWFALLAMINPWTIKLLRHPIVETALVFFIVLTFYFIVRRSHWCYFFAALTTMTRYEGAALIMVAFVLDMIDSATWRQRFLALLLSFLAAIPLSLWMYGTYTYDKAFQRTGEKKGAGHYISHYKIKQKTVVGEFADYSWQVSMGPLLGRASQASEPAKPSTSVMVYPLRSDAGRQEFLVFRQLPTAGKIILIAGLILAAGNCTFRRHWKVLPLLLFLIAYFLAHSLRYGTQDRYAWPISWLLLLLCCYGFQSGWHLLKKFASIPRPVLIALQSALIIAALVWLSTLIRFLPSIAPYSQKSTSLPYVALVAVIAVLLGGAFIYRSRFLWRDLCLAVVVGLMVISNQFTLARTVGNGSGDLEFKLLADWYVKNAQPGEKLASTMHHIVSLYAPEYRGNFVKTSRITGYSPEQFVENCYKANITYVAWDSRIGLWVGSPYYNRWRIKNMQMLSQPRDIGPFIFVDQIKVSPRRFIYIFRLKPLAPEATK